MLLRKMLGLAHTNEKKNERGSALPMGLLVLLALTLVAASMMAVATTDFTIATNWKSYNDAFYAAEAGVESGVVGLRGLLKNATAPTTAQLNAIAAPTLNSSHATYSAYSVTALNAVPYQTQFTTGGFSGLSGLVTDYAVNAQTTGRDGSAANVTQVYKYVQVPLFQFAVFYGAGVDLEMAPGANMTINGKVFANSNIYLSPQASLQINGQVSTAGNIYRTIKRNGTEGYGNNPQIMAAGGTYQTLNFDHVDKQNFAGSWSASQWMSAAQSTFGSTVKDSTMGVQQITPPIPSLFDNPSNPDQVAHQLIEMPQSGDSAALKAAKMYSQAGLLIVNGTVTYGNGNPVTLPVGTITTTSSFYDSREGQMMTVTQIDVSKLTSAIPTSAGGTCMAACLTVVASGNAGWNGILYVAATTNGFGPSTPCSTNTSKPCPAVRLVNGSTNIVSPTFCPSPPCTSLPSSGLTVVSQNPVYIQGDYNPGSPTTQASAAVLADAVTVLSNNWKDSNATGSSSTLSSRGATQTVVNAAIATGPSNESALNSGNGQLENDIRFLENWSGVTFTYSGSLVDLWHSEQVTQPWQNTGVYYNAPVRNWSYDTRFNTTPPPGTPMGTVMLKGTWSRL